MGFLLAMSPIYRTPVRVTPATEGVILIGPIPVVFGSSPKNGRNVYDRCSWVDGVEFLLFRRRWSLMLVIVGIVLIFIGFMMLISPR